MKSVYITVRLDLADEADVDEVVQEMFYNFEYGNDILGTEITGIVSEPARQRIASGGGLKAMDDEFKEVEGNGIACPSCGEPLYDVDADWEKHGYECRACDYKGWGS